MCMLNWQPCSQDSPVFTSGIMRTPLKLHACKFHSLTSSTSKLWSPPSPHLLLTSAAKKIFTAKQYLPPPIRLAPLTHVQTMQNSWLLYRSVPKIRPPFCNLSLSTKCRGGLFAGCDNFSRDYTLPSDKAWPHLSFVGGGWKPSARSRRAWGGEMLPTLAVGWRASALRDEKAGHFHKVAGVSIVDAGSLCSW